MIAQDDAITALANTLDALDAHIRTSDATVTRSERNRLSMLHVHAVCAMFIAPLFVTLGRQGMRGSIWSVARLIPGSPLTLAVVLFIGGVILAVATWYRRVWWEMVGLWMLLCWYATIAASFAAAIALWVLQGAPPGPSKPALYAPLVYFHFTVIMAVHLRTLHRIRRGRPR